MSDDRQGPTPVREDGKQNPILALESRPSSLTGISFWLVLAYKQHSFEALLPADFFAMEDTERDLVIAKEAGELKRKLRPILEAEDRLVIPV